MPSVGNKEPLICNKGFTLIELIITLTIAGILSVIAIPALQQFVASTKLTTATNDLIADLAMSRGEAIRRSKPVIVCASTDGTSCTASTSFVSGWIIFEDTDTGGTWTTGDVLMRHHEALTGITSVTGSSTLIYSRVGFNASGALDQVVLCNSTIHKARTISIESTGRSSLSQGTC